MWETEKMSEKNKDTVEKQGGKVKRRSRRECTTVLKT